MKTYKIVRMLPIIRHIRWLYWVWQVERHYNFWYQATGALPVYHHVDEEFLSDIWHGRDDME